MNYNLQFKNKKKTSLVLSLLLAVFFLILPSKALAVCPVCTVAVIGGLGLSRYLGIDDSISGIWIGGLIISLSFWLVEWAYKKYPRIEKFNKNVAIALSILFWYAFTFIPLKYTNILGHPFNKLLGMDKLIFGSLVGSVVFLLAIWADKKVRKMKGKQLFIYQKVVFPVVTLTVTSLIVYFWGGYLY